MTADQTVFVSTAAAVVVAVGLIVTGVAVLAGMGWALITAGALLAVSSVSTGYALLREGKT